MFNVRTPYKGLTTYDMLCCRVRIGEVAQHACLDGSPEEERKEGAGILGGHTGCHEVLSSAGRENGRTLDDIASRTRSKASNETEREMKWASCLPAEVVLPGVG